MSALISGRSLARETNTFIQTERFASQPNFYELHDPYVSQNPLQLGESYHLQSPDLADDHTGQGPDNHANAETQPELCDLRQALTISEDDDSDVEDQLDRLKDVAH